MNRCALIAGGAAAFTLLHLPAQGQTENPDVIRIALTTNDAAAEVLYAKDLGMFEKARLPVSLQVVANGSLIASGLVSGSLDIGNSNVLSIVVAYKKGVPLTIVAPASIYDGTVPQLSLIVASNSNVKTAKNLEGAVIATNPSGGIGEFATMEWMEKRGADPTTLKWIEMPFAEMGPALTQGRINAAAVTEPFSTLDKATTRTIGAPYSAVAPSFLTVGWIASSQWAKSHPDAVSRFAGVMREAAIWANKNRAESGAILAKYAKMNVALVNQMARVTYGETLTAKLVQPNIDLAAKYKLIDARFSAQDIVYQPAR